MSGRRNFLLLMISISILVFSTCSRKEVEIVIQEESVPAADSEKATTNIDEESKPLIRISPTDTVEIVVRQDGAPGMYLGEDGELHGFYVDLEKMVMKEMGQTYRMTPYSDVGPVAVGLKSGIYHIGLSVPDLIDFRAFLNLSIPYEVLHFVTFVQSGNSDIDGSTREELMKSLYGKKVGVQTRGHIYQVLRDIREIELIEYPTTTQALEDLNTGLLDAVPDVKRIGLYYAAKNGWNIEPRGEAIISHKITTAFSQRLDTSLLDRYNKALQRIISDGRLETLYVSSFGEMNDEDKPWLNP